MEKQIKQWLKKIKENESSISMILGGIVVVIVALLLVNYYRQSQKSAQITQQSEATTSAEYTLQTVTDEKTGEVMPTGLPEQHTVAQGEYLWTIAQKYYGSGYNWVDIATANKLSNANIVAAGTKLALPKTRIRKPIAAAKSTVAPKPTNVISVTATLIQDTYTVRSGDTLWGIANNMFKDGYKWIDIYNANKTTIKDPGVIEIGWKLTIPKN